MKISAKLLLVVFCLLYASPAHAGTISHERHETPAHAYYASLPAGYRLTERENVEVMRLAGWDESVIPEAVQIIDCESGGIVGAIGDGGLAISIFQIHAYGWMIGYPEAFVDFEGDPHNVIDNARLALLIYERGESHGNGWFNWSCAKYMHNF